MGDALAKCLNHDRTDTERILKYENAFSDYILLVFQERRHKLVGAVGYLNMCLSFEYKAELCTEKRLNKGKSLSPMSRTSKSPPMILHLLYCPTHFLHIYWQFLINIKTIWVQNQVLSWQMKSPMADQVKSKRLWYNGLIINKNMFWGSEQIESSFKILNSILLCAIIAIVITQFVLKQVQPLELLVLVLIYVVLMWQRITVYTYRIVIFVGLAFILREGLALLNFCFGEQNSLLSQEKMATIEPSQFRNIIIVSGLWILIMCYALVLCWRAYEKSKLYTMLTQEFIFN